MPSRHPLTTLLRPLRSYAARVTERADADAVAAGLTVEVLAGGVGRYRDPRLDQLAARRISRPTANTPAAAADVDWSPPRLVGPAAPATSPLDRLRRTEPSQGPGRYQTRSPTSSRSAQDRSQTAPLRSAAPGTILRSRLDMGHPAGPVPDALRAGGEEHAPARPGSGPRSTP